MFSILVGTCEMKSARHKRSGSIQRNANANSTSQNLGSARYINTQSRNANCTKIENLNESYSNFTH